jgi:hypothetical protein
VLSGVTKSSFIFCSATTGEKFETRRAEVRPVQLNQAFTPCMPQMGLCKAGGCDAMHAIATAYRKKVGARVG